MKKLTTLVLIIFPLLIWAHMDKYYTYEYKNVTVRFKTGFFYEEINNVKIIGEYAALLTDSLNYDQPVLLDFIHDYGRHTYKDKNYYFLNNGSEEYEMVSFYQSKYDSTLDQYVFHMVSYSDYIENPDSVIQYIDTVPRISQIDKIVIRQFGFHFDITHTLNLLYYAINNKNEISNLGGTDTLYSYLPNAYYRFKSVPESVTDSIKGLLFPYVKRILEYPVYREADSVDRHHLYYSYYSKNGKFLIFAGFNNKEFILDTLDQVYSFNPVESLMLEPLFVFETPDQLRKYELEIFNNYTAQRSERHEVTIAKDAFIQSIDVAWLGHDIYLIDYNDISELFPFKRFLYLGYDDVLINDFESFINSHRINKDNK